MPRITVLYEDGNLVHFNKSSGCWPKWSSTTITSELQQNFGDSLKDIKELVSFRDGEVLCCSNKKVVALDKKGRVLCERTSQEQDIKKVAPTLPYLKKISFFLRDENDKSIATWTRHNWRNKLGCDFTSGSWDIQSVDQDPPRFLYSRNGSNTLILDHTTPGEPPRDYSDDDLKTEH